MTTNNTVFSNETARNLFRFLQDNEPVGEGRVLIREGEQKVFKEYTVPLDLLMFNDSNFRIRHQIVSKSGSEMLSSLSLETNNEQEVIYKELLVSDIPTNESTYKSIRDNGLRDSIIVRLADAVVVDGNRRLMTHRKLVSDGFGKFNTIRAIVVDEQLSNQEWLELEARYQFEAETKSYYDNVNEAMILRELFQIYRDYKKVAQKVNSQENHVKSRINTLDLIDDFLERIGKGREYSIIKSFSLFTELVKELSRKENKITAEEYMALETTGLNAISLKIIREQNENQEITVESDDDFSLDVPKFRKILKAFDINSAKDAMIQTIGTESVLTLEQMKDRATEFTKDIDEALIIQAADKQANEPARMLKLAISHLQSVQKVDNENRQTVLEKLDEITNELTRIFEMYYSNAR